MVINIFIFLKVNFKGKLKIKMGYISIYRKWRPQNFSDIIGQDDIIKSLKNAIRINRLSHAYIFCGPRGTGKTSTARIFAKAINCQNRDKDKNNVEPCNICENCISITNGTNVDVIEIDAASHRKVEPTRDLIESVNYLPNFLKKKVYIIDEVHMLTDAAFNTLLKTLEEPPEHVIFILATTEPNKVLPTILSRCQRYNFKPITSDSITKRLKMIASAEKIDINDAALSLISKYSGGSQRDANVILEKLASLDEDKIKVEDVATLLGAVDFEILFELTDILIEGNVSEAIFFEHRLQESYQNLKLFIEEFINHLQTLFIIKNYESAYEILNINAEYKEKYSNQSKLINNNALQFYIELFSDLYKELKISEGNKILFKSALIKALTYFKSKPQYNEKVNYDVLVKKMADFENELNNLNLKIFEIQKNFENFPQYTVNKSLNLQDMEIKKELSFLSDKKQDESKINNKKVEEKEFEKKDDDKNKAVKEQEQKTKQILSDKDNIGQDIKDKNKHENISDENLTNLIKSNWSNICNAIKSRQKGIPLYAMFIEAKKIKITGDAIFFYLPNNNKFHKENLNKVENIEKIKDSIKEVTGKEFKIGFFFENEGKDFINIKDLSDDDIKKRDSASYKPKEKIETKQVSESEIIKEQISSQYSRIKEKSKEVNNFNDSVVSNDSKIDEYDYFEKKFGLKKEKKSGD